jgi:hypothetical protein
MEREIYGLEQSNHGHLHRWIFTKESLLEQGIDPYDTDCIDIGFPIGGSNSSGTYIRKLNTEEEIKDFLLEEYETEYEDPMLVDIAEGIYTIDMDDEYHGSITTEYVKLFGIPEEELTKENSLLKYAEEANVSISASNGCIVAEGINENAVVTVYSVDGREAYKGNATSISVVPGMYIVVVDTPQCKPVRAKVCVGK